MEDWKEALVRDEIKRAAKMDKRIKKEALDNFPRLLPGHPRSA